MKKILLTLGIAATTCLVSCNCDCPDTCPCNGSCGSNCACTSVEIQGPLTASPSKFKNGEVVSFRLALQGLSASVNGKELQGKVEYYIDDKLVAVSDDEENDYLAKETISGFAEGAHKLTAKFKADSEQINVGTVTVNPSVMTEFGPVTIYVEK